MANVVVPAVASSTRTVPDAPTNVSATDVGTSRAYDNGAATVTYTAPTWDGKLPITNYVVTGNPGGSANDAGGSPTTVTGLDTSPSGTNHTFTVVATNAIGNSSSSSASASELITSVPGTPPTPTATRTNDTTVSISWTGSPNSGGKTVTGYTITSSPSLSLSYSGSDITSPISVTGTYVANQAYTFTLKAVNANGESVASTASNSVTPYTSVTVPDAPTIGTATRINDTTVDVAFTAPANNGGATITSYTIEGRRVSNQSSITLTRSDPTDITSPIRVTMSPVEGVDYEFRIAATNSAGTGAFSAWSNDVTVNPYDPPGVPGSRTASVVNTTTVNLSYTAPTSDLTVTQYNLSSTPSAGISPTTTTSLTPSVTGTFTKTVPGTPSGVSAIGTGTTDEVELSFTPAASGGTSYVFNISATSAAGTGSSGSTNSVIPNPDPVTGYTITSSPSVSLTYNSSDTTSPITVTGAFAANTSYTLTMRANNSTGQGGTATSGSVIPDPRRLCTSAQITIGCCTSTAECFYYGAGSTCTTINASPGPGC